MKSGNRNFLEPSGPLQACNGTALPFTNQFTHIICARTYTQTIPRSDITQSPYAHTESRNYSQ